MWIVFVLIGLFIAYFVITILIARLGPPEWVGKNHLINELKRVGVPSGTLSNDNLDKLVQSAINEARLHEKFFKKDFFATYADALKERALVFRGVLAYQNEPEQYEEMLENFLNKEEFLKVDF